MICKQCKSEIQMRLKGRGRKPYFFCPGKPCKDQFYAEARRVGVQALRKQGAKGQRRPRVSLAERIELEAQVAEYPAMYARPGSRPAVNLRVELCRAARRLNVLR